MFYHHKPSFSILVFALIFESADSALLLQAVYFYLEVDDVDENGSWNINGVQKLT